MTQRGLGKRISRRMEVFSQQVTDWTGRTAAFALALSVIVAWLVTGPIFRFSDTWQLVINTSTTIVTFLMVFLIQRAQNKGTRAMELKLNEIIAAIEGASNRLIDVEELSEDELEVLHEHYRQLVRMAKRDLSLTKSHSIEEAEARHTIKFRPRTPVAAPPDGRTRPRRGPRT